MFRSTILAAVLGITGVGLYAVSQPAWIMSIAVWRGTPERTADSGAEEWPICTSMG
jgi:hypothetical protein